MTILNKEKILDQAKAFIDEGKFDKAIREYEKIALADPSDLRVKLKIAELYTKRKQITDAIRIYREVSRAYADEGFYLKAVTVHKNILRLNPSLIEINRQLAELYEKMGLIADAVRQYDILASALEHKGESECALEIRSKIVLLNPSDGTARIKLAETYQREGKMDDSIGQYEEHARQLESSGANPARLADVFEKILTHRPERHDMFKKLIGIFEKTGDTKKMLKWLESGKNLVENDPELLGRLARIYAGQNQNETARAKYMRLAELYREKEDIDGALGAYFEILVLLPDEEDRLARIVDELKPGAMADIAGRAAQRRKEIEEETSLKEEELERERMEGAKPKTNKAGAKKTGREEEITSDIIEKKMEKPKTLAVKTPNKREAGAAFDLGVVYQRTGLDDEAKAEFEKARGIYEACLSSQAADEDIKKRLAEIESFLAHKSPEPAPERKGTSKKKKSSE